MKRFTAIIGLAILLAASAGLAPQSSGVVTRATEDLLQALVGKPGLDPNSPARPEMSLQLKRGVAKELWDNPTIQASFNHLAATRRDYDWFRAIEELEESKAAWCLASGLCHPSSVVRIRSAQSLNRLRTVDPAPFVLEVADAFAVTQEGAGASNNAQFQHTLATLLNKYTGLSVSLKEGQDAEALRAALPGWKRALRERSGPIVRSDKAKAALDAARSQIDTVVVRVVLFPAPEGQWDADFPLTKATLAVAELTTEAPAPGPSGKPDLVSASMTPDQAALVLDALADASFFDRAQASRPTRSDRHAFIEVSFGEGTSAGNYCLVSPWNTGVIDFVNPVANSLDGDAAKAMKQLMAPLHARQRKAALAAAAE